VRSEFTGEHNAQLVPGVLYGVRAFFLNFDATLASPVYSAYEWKDGEMEAICNSGYHVEDMPVGTINCYCGFYSFHEPEGAREYYYGEHLGMLGVIEAYGHVTIGNRGMRSSKARVVGLVVPRTRWRKKVKRSHHEAMLKNYPSASTFETLEEAAAAFRINGRPKILT
jgi:hypothetical protein